MKELPPIKKTSKGNQTMNQKEFTDSEIIPISSISHHLYCPRQNALIHVLGVFADNELTVSGDIGHEFVDQEESYEDHNVYKETSYRVFSEILGISGIADIIEFPKDKPPYPIDYKNGKLPEDKEWINMESQLCAIAMALEEMLDTEVPKGAIYHIQSKKRREVVFTKTLRELTTKTIQEIREMLLKSEIPIIAYSKLCRRCSLLEICMPKLNQEKTKINPFKPLDL